MATVTFEFAPKWWLCWYLSGVVLMSRLTGLEPNEDRVVYWVMRGMKMRVR